MTNFIMRRLLLMIPTLLAISVISFLIIQLPPGDYLEQKITKLEQQNGDTSSRVQAQALRRQYGLDKPLCARYFHWLGGITRGDFGESFRYNRQVRELIWNRLGATLLISFAAMLVMYLLAIGLGCYAAMHKDGLVDRLLMVAAVIGMSLPSFLVALSLIVAIFAIFGIPLYGLVSLRYEDAPWSMAKIGDLICHIWIPVLVIAGNGTATLMRIMRNNLLDVLTEPFVRTARAKGLSEKIVVARHAARIAINPLISMIGMSLPELISGTTIVSIVLGLPTIGLLLYQALLDEDTYLAGTIIMLMALLQVTGNLLADLALTRLDPRIQYN